jgi:hypothetical protein
MDDEAKVPHYVEMWKQTIAVQQHFNDIEWRIRSLALTALTFALGAAALAARQKSAIQLFGWQMQLSFTILILGLFLWLAFYFVDQIWYHRLLIGAVKHGEALEEVLRGALPEAGLTMQISKSSPYQFNIGFGRFKYCPKEPMHSSAKMRTFYMIGALALLLPAIAFQVSG